MLHPLLFIWQNKNTFMNLGFCSVHGQMDPSLAVICWWWCQCCWC